MRKLVFLLASITITHACSCSGFASKQYAFCKVNFVSHAKVVSKSTEFSHGSPEFKYGIEHMEVFKMPKGLSELPTQFTSQSLPERCGIELDLGKEYLLSGYDTIRTMNHQSSCILLGLISEDGTGYLIHCPAIAGLLREWNGVSAEDKYELSTFTCE